MRRFVLKTLERAMNSGYKTDTTAVARNKYGMISRRRSLEINMHSEEDPWELRPIFRPSSNFRQISLHTLAWALDRFVNALARY
jgi:hypothetical protein